MVDLDAYFARIGYAGPRAPTLAVLEALTALHPAAIPFEAIDCLLDRPIQLAPEAVDAKLIHGRRGGYCFEQNSLFQRVLEALGFAVTPLAGRMRWGAPDDAPLRPRTHMVLKVEVEGQAYLADVGFGACVPAAPWRLAPGEVQTLPHDTYRLVAIPEGVATEVLREGRWIRIYDVSMLPCVPADYEMANWFSCTFPASHFRHNLLAARTTPQARHNLLFNRLTIRPVHGGPVEKRELDEAQLEAALREVFGLDVQPDWRPLIQRAVAHGPDGV